MLLDMSKNELRTLPSEIGQCSRLADLYLDENQIAYLPDAIGKKPIVALSHFGLAIKLN